MAETQKPTSSKSDPATFLAPEGPAGTVASSMGPLPVGAVARDEDHAEELLAEQEARVADEEGTSALDRKLTDKEIEDLGAADLRAVAATRGYKDFPQAGANATRQAFRRAQAGDDRFKVAAKK